MIGLKKGVLAKKAPSGMSVSDDMKYTRVNLSKGGILTCLSPVLVHPDPSEKATFSLLNTDPVIEGDTVTMKCETDGNPQPEFDFAKDVRVPPVCKLRGSDETLNFPHSAFSPNTRILLSSGQSHHWSRWSPDCEIRQAH